MPLVRPFRCFNTRLIGIALLVAFAIIACAWVGRGLPLRSPPRVLAAAVQAAAFAWLVLEMIRSVRALDELERRIHADALAGAAGLIVVAIGCWGFLVKAGLPEVEWSLWILPMLSITWSLGVAWISRRYR